MELIYPIAGNIATLPLIKGHQEAQLPSSIQDSSSALGSVWMPVDLSAIASVWDVRSFLLFVCSACFLSDTGFFSVWGAIAQSRVRMGTLVLVGQTSGLPSPLPCEGLEQACPWVWHAWFRDLMGKCLYIAQSSPGFYIQWMDHSKCLFQ